MADEKISKTSAKKEEAATEEAAPELPVVTYEGKEVTLDPDLNGRILSFIAANAAAELPVHTDPEWTNPELATAET